MNHRICVPDPDLYNNCCHTLELNSIWTDDWSAGDHEVWDASWMGDDGYSGCGARKIDAVLCSI